jgi:hypothetical protein
MISSTTRAAIKGYLEGFIQAMILEHKQNALSPTDIRPTRTFSADGDIKPFHEALLPNGILTINEFERSFSTKLGSSFEESARLIAKDIYSEAKRSCIIQGTVSLEAIRIIENMVNDIDRGGMKKSYLELVKHVLAVSQNPTIERKTIADLYLRDRDGDELFFEIKSPKPNKGQCLEVSDRLLLIHAIMRAEAPRVRTYYAMAYNPYGDDKARYKHSFALNYLDVNNQVLIGKEFWEIVGGRGTYEEVLEIYREVGREKGSDMLDQLALDY